VGNTGRVEAEIHQEKREKEINVNKIKKWNV
jgi:hypothetical protein